MIKALIIFVLAVGVFGSGAYWTYELFLRPGQELREDKLTAPEYQRVDPSLADFERCATLQKELKLIEARSAWAQFVEQFPQSTKIDEAKDRLGELNSTFFFSSGSGSEKEEYVVKSGDVLNKVAARMKTTPELLMRTNRLNGTLLRIGQKLVVAPGSFSVVLSKPRQMVTVLKDGKFFRQYPIRNTASGHAPIAKKGKPAATPAGPKMAGKISEKIAWGATGQRLTFADKDYAEAAHWIAFSGGLGTLYSDLEPQEGRAAPKPPHGLGLAPEHMDELAALLRRGDPVTIEP